jgi:hypothetical protein
MQQGVYAIASYYKTTKPWGRAGGKFPAWENSDFPFQLEYFTVDHWKRDFICRKLPKENLKKNTLRLGLVYVYPSDSAKSKRRKGTRQAEVIARRTTVGGCVALTCDVVATSGPSTPNGSSSQLSLDSSAGSDANDPHLKNLELLLRAHKQPT